jgi:hypothetical protein
MFQQIPYTPNGYTVDQYYISNGQLQMMQQQQLIQQEQHLVQQQHQQQQFVPQPFHPIQQSGYSITPVQHTNCSAPSFVTKTKLRTIRTFLVVFENNS